MSNIEWADFEKIDIRVGTITSAEEFPKARKPAYRLTIDFGNGMTRRSSAQVTGYYKPEELLNKQIIAVVNFPPKRIADFESECLVLGIYDETREVVLLQPERPVQNGCRIG